MATSPYQHLDVEKIVAIDFGSFGFAACYCTLDSPEDQRIVENWTITRAAADLNKNLAALLISKDTKETIAIGYDAEEQYANLIEKKEDHNYMYFQHFKPLLYSKDHLRKNVPVKSSDDKSSLPLSDLITKSFEAIMNHALQFINDFQKLAGIDPIKATQVYWVLSVPAIWDEMSKEMMKACATKAGMRHFSLGSEPTCTVFHVLNNNGPDLKLNNKSGLNQFIVLDCGGGTIDASCVEISTQTGNVNELRFSEGIRCGGLDVDDQFVKLLTQLLPNDVITKIQNSQPGEWVRQRQEFISAKFSLSPTQFDTCEFWNVDFCFGLKQWLSQQKKKSKKKDKKDNTYKELQNKIKSFEINAPFVESKEEKKNDDGMVSGQFKLGKGTIKIKSAGWLWLHENVLRQIVVFLRKLINNAEVSECDNIILSGGFANSEYLKDRLHREFPNKTFHVPQHPHLAVVKGALYWVKQAGREEEKGNGSGGYQMKKRRAKYSYGIAINRKWNGDSDSKARRIDDEELGPIVKNAFGMLVARNEEYDDGHTEDFDYWIPRNTKTINIVLYASEDRFCRYVFEEDGKTLPIADGKKCAQVKEFPLTLNTIYEEKQDFKISLEYRQDGINLSFIDPNNGKRTYVNVNTSAKPGV